jgi:hypothetical protein
LSFLAQWATSRPPSLLSVPEKKAPPPPWSAYPPHLQSIFQSTFHGSNPWARHHEDVMYVFHASDPRAEYLTDLARKDHDGLPKELKFITGLRYRSSLVRLKKELDAHVQWRSDLDKIAIYWGPYGHGCACTEGKDCRIRWSCTTRDSDEDIIGRVPRHLINSDTITFNHQPQPQEIYGSDDRFEVAHADTNDLCALVLLCPI